MDAAAAEGDEPRARRRRLAAAFSGRPAEGVGGQTPEGEASASGLASIGLADEDEDDLRRYGYDDYDPGEDDDRDPEPDSAYDGDERLGYEDGYLEDASWPPRRRRRDPEPDGPAWARRDVESPGGYAGRLGDADDRPLPDWDWPRYSDVDDSPPAGDYWTPVPDLYAPPELDALPPVPDYEPATGFDLPAGPAEPLGPVPEWPPRERRVRLPLSWAERDEQEGAENRPSPRPRPAPPYAGRHSAGPN
ncbi:hypothetical protein Ait01nite_007980 [Actinoplanes italicus]|uniref:Uncharacterized protein n=2 Tax=Actinoplanes italicus TaxID=113567 RepID=A0A2T0KLL2_9ACTN|nr:hypothetical protein CLV67_102297 [Actinoplanes italicus]GIE27753.1 hypothetical protein Ait01nite_007980 [Actinoplanes italicus]